MSMAITILTSCRDGRTELEQLDRQIERWSRAVGDDGSKLARLRADRDARAARREAEVVYACSICDRLRGIEADVIYAYYVEGVTLAALARARGYSEGYLRNVRRRAERRIVEEIPDDTTAAAMPGWYRTR